MCCENPISFLLVSGCHTKVVLVYVFEAGIDITNVHRDQARGLNQGEVSLIFRRFYFIRAFSDFKAFLYILIGGFS